MSSRSCGTYTKKSHDITHLLPAYTQTVPHSNCCNRFGLRTVCFWVSPSEKFLLKCTVGISHKTPYERGHIHDDSFVVCFLVGPHIAYGERVALVAISFSSSSPSDLIESCLAADDSQPGQPGRLTPPLRLSEFIAGMHMYICMSLRLEPFNYYVT